MARMMDSLILDNFGPFAFTKITTSHHTHHRLPSRASVLKKSSVGSTSTSNLPQTTGHPQPAQTMRINLHRNSTSNAMGAKVAYANHGEWNWGYFRF